jgi:hypothetical protein
MNPIEYQRPTPMPRYKTWAIWIGRVVLVPVFTATCAGLVFGLYRFVTTGQMSSPSRNFGPASSTIHFSDHPIWFLVLLFFYMLMVANFIIGTYLLARLFFSRESKGAK